MEQERRYLIKAWIGAHSGKQEIQIQSNLQS